MDLLTEARWRGGVAMVGSLLVAIACRAGIRDPDLGRQLRRATGIFALTVSGVFVLPGLLLTLFTPGRRRGHW